jgi:hypothetical protein
MVCAGLRCGKTLTRLQRDGDAVLNGKSDFPDSVLRLDRAVDIALTAFVVFALVTFSYFHVERQSGEL